ncbi:MAG: signal peptidase I [Acidobacteria bacterium]|nr:signal peptidase I [Acidobacteriota bacterium]
MATTEEETEEKSDDATRDGEDAPKGPAPHSLLREYFESGAVVLVMAMFFMTFVAQAAEVPSASMENTVYVGDRFLINKFVFGPGPHLPFLPQRDIRRGDIVVFKYPAESIPAEKIVQYKTLFIKRVIGLPGETIEVKGRDVYINGQLLPEYRVESPDCGLGNDKAPLNLLTPERPRAGEPYTVYYRNGKTCGEDRSGGSDAPNGVRRPYRIPEGHYFMMGDNRENSRDSRYWGPVSRDLIVGRAMFVIWSYDEAAHQDTSGLSFVRNFFNNTRWGRIGTLLR